MGEVELTEYSVAGQSKIRKDGVAREAVLRPEK